MEVFQKISYICMQSFCQYYLLFFVRDNHEQLMFYISNQKNKAFLT